MDGKVYLEEGPYRLKEKKEIKNDLNDIGRQIEYAMSSKLFPRDKPIQFWTHVNCDSTNWLTYDGRRLDLLHPSMWWDNNPNTFKVIVHPDPYLFLDYPQSVAYW
jgi:hypothetical protein